MNYNYRERVFGRALEAKGEINVEIYADFPKVPAAKNYQQLKRENR